MGDERPDVDACAARLGHSFADPELLARALTHASAAAGELDSNERLEFLGDAVIGLVVCRHLFATHLAWREGNLTAIKGAAVSTDALARAARALDLGACMRLDRSLTGARRLPASVLAGVFEAVTGALYLDGGYEAATRFVLDALADELEQATAEVGASNYKSVLQERVQIDGGPAPVYRVVEEFGPDHRKLFHVEVTGVDGLLGRGVGGSKKIAEQSAAEDALRLLDERQAQAEDGSAQE